MANWSVLSRVEMGSKVAFFLSGNCFVHACSCAGDEVTQNLLSLVPSLPNKVGMLTTCTLLLSMAWEWWWLVIGSSLISSLGLNAGTFEVRGEVIMTKKEFEENNQLVHAGIGTVACPWKLSLLYSFKFVFLSCSWPKMIGKLSQPRATSAVNLCFSSLCHVFPHFFLWF